MVILWILALALGAATQIGRVTRLTYPVWPLPLIPSVTDDPYVVFGLALLVAPLMRVVMPAAAGLGDGLRERLYRWAKGPDPPQTSSG